MARVFVSHASSDSPLASEVHGWLTDAGHESFFDRDPARGIAVGDEWERRLHRQLRSADAIVCIVTSAFVASTWCTGEVAIARAYGCRLLPVLVEPAAKHPFLSSVQHVALADGEQARVQMLEVLRRVDAGGRPGWRPGDPPFPGLRPFDRDQHEVFFGRTGEVNHLAALLRSPAQRGDAAIQLVVGPSGCGKSSLVRAGLVPLLAGEPGWWVLTPMVPGVDPVGALVRELAAAAREVGVERALNEMREQLRTDGLAGLVDELLHAAPGPRRNRMLLVVDQFEELLAQTPQSARTEFVALLRPASAGPLQVVATLRPEFLDQMLISPDLAELATHTFTVRPLATAALPEVIEGPARLARMGLEKGLVARLVADTEGGEALPLLAYTLAQLAEGIGSGGQLTMARYEQLGGVRGAVTQQAAAALQQAVAGAGRTERQVVSDLLRLVTVDERGRPTRRRVPTGELPQAVVAALTPFVERRLLNTDIQNGGAVIEVAHESFVTSWAPLAEAVRVNSNALRARRGIEVAATQWESVGEPRDRLWERGQLAAALADTGARAGRTVVTELVDVSPLALRFLRLSWRRDRLRRARSTLVLAVLLVIALAAASVAAVQLWSATQQQRLATSRFLANQAQAALSDDPRTALRLGEAAQHLSPDAESRAQLAHLLRTTPYAGSLTGSGPLDVAAFSPDSRVLATGSEDHTVVLWDVADPVRARQFAPPLPHPGAVVSLAFSPDDHTLAVGGADGSVALWDVADPADARSLGPPLRHTGAVTEVALSPDGTAVAAVAEDGIAVLWNVTEPRAAAPVRRIKHAQAVSAVAFSPDGHLLATAGADRLVALWDLRDTARTTPLGEPLRSGEFVSTVMFGPDGRTLAVAGLLANAALWDIADPQRPQLLAPLSEDHAVSGFAFSPDGRMLVTAGRDRKAVQWDLADRARPRVIRELLPEHARARFPVALSPDGRRLATGRVDRAVDLWHLDEPAQPQRATLEHSANVTAAAFAPSGTVLAVGVAGTVSLWDTRDPTRAMPLGDPLVGHQDSIFAVTFDPSGRVLATAGADRTVILWDVTDPARAHPMGPPLSGHDGVVATVAFSPDGRIMTTGGWDNRTVLWDVSDPARPRQLEQPLVEHTGWVNEAAFATDGNLLATASEDHTLRLWDISDPDRPRRLGEPIEHPGAVDSVAFAPDGRTLATAVGNDTVQFWDISDPIRPERLSQPLRVPGYAAAVSFSPDGRTLAVGSGNNTVTLWDITNLGRPQQMVESVNESPDAAGVVRFTADGRTLATQDGTTIRLWDLTYMIMIRDHALARACALTDGGLDPEEWSRTVPVLPFEDSCQPNP